MFVCSQKVLKFIFVCSIIIRRRCKGTQDYTAAIRIKMKKADSMKTVFIINPSAGQGCNENLIEKILGLSQENTEAYITRFPGDATEYVRSFCQKHDKARFIACGGDGTLNEVLNGVVGFENAEIGIIPSGTGNDFCRNFEPHSPFCDISAQINGERIKCDAIKYTTETDLGTTSGYCVNMFNIGFDCNVAALTAQMKKKPFISGSLAYLISIFVTLIKKKGANLKIEIDGKERHSGKLLLTSIANGCFCGGGIKSNPTASVCDGKISINIIKNISRIRFLTLLPYYMKGTFTKIKNIEKIITSEKCSEIVLTPLDGKMKICVDGEIADAGKTTGFSAA